MVAIFSPLAFTCKPLSEVTKIGFSSLNFKATVRILLSGDFLLKSSGNKLGSDNSMETLSLSIALFINLNAVSTFLFSSLLSFIFNLSSSSITFADKTMSYFESIFEMMSGQLTKTLVSIMYKFFFVEDFTAFYFWVSNCERSIFPFICNLILLFSITFSSCSTEVFSVD